MNDFYKVVCSNSFMQKYVRILELFQNNKKWRKGYCANLVFFFQTLMIGDKYFEVSPLLHLEKTWNFPQTLTSFPILWIHYSGFYPRVATFSSLRSFPISNLWSFHYSLTGCWSGSNWSKINIVLQKRPFYGSSYHFDNFLR